MPKFMTLTSVLALVALATTAHAARPQEPKTEAAVLAADDDWLAAELRGDVAALDARLGPTYRDITSNGKVHVKAEMLDALGRLKSKATGPAAKVAADSRAAHPMVEKVVIVGDTAMLSFHSIEPAQQAAVRSVDVFVYEDGVWRAVLSVDMAPAAALAAATPG
jgi:Domain of unknown function (DUF4440)